MRIELKAVCKRYADTLVLDHCDLQIDSGESVALLGRSGSGKSTVLHLLAGIERADSGAIELDGEDQALLDDRQRTLLRRRRIGLIFQSYNLIPALNVIDNVALPLELCGHKPAEARRQATELLQQLDLHGLETRHADQLSGGQQQRVAVARCLAHRPGLVLADEPTASLDADSAQQVLDLLEESCRTRGVTLVMATHAQDVMKRADRLLTLIDGRFQALPRTSPQSA